MHNYSARLILEPIVRGELADDTNADAVHASHPQKNRGLKHPPLGIAEEYPRVQAIDEMMAIAPGV
jgi:hypothetical protein